MGAFTTMTSKGQLTIPKEVRERLNLKAGTRLYVTDQDGEVILKAKNKRAVDLAGILGPPPSSETLTNEQIDEAIGRAVGEDDSRIIREWHGDNE